MRIVGNFSVRIFDSAATADVRQEAVSALIGWMQGGSVMKASCRARPRHNGALTLKQQVGNEIVSLAGNTDDPPPQ